jgi:hypothetical protein
MKKIVSAILVSLTCALSGCMAEPMDSAEIENELSAEASFEASAVSIDDNDAMVEETNAGGCTYSYRTAILRYYWTQKPLCAQGARNVYCAVERQIDPLTPCKLAVCADYVLICDSDPNYY